MLVQFSVENFLSFDDEQVFSLVATNDDQHPRHSVANIPRKGEAVLRGAAIYGANAAGKSNLVQAMSFARRLIVEGTRSSQALPFRPFKMRPSDAPSKFEFVIQAQGIVYNYGFRADAERIHEEWLFATPNKQEVSYFQRTTGEDRKVEVEFGPSFTGRTKRQEQFLGFVAQATRHNELFLTKAVDSNVTDLNPVYEWFDKTLLVISAETPAMHLEMTMQENEPLTRFLEIVLRSTGTGVERTATEEVAFDLNGLTQPLPQGAKERIETELDSSEAVAVNLYGPQERRLMLKRGERGQIVQILLRLQHSGKDGQLVDFSLDEESDGTQRLINLIPALMMLRENASQVVVIDELDRRLHTLLSRFFIQAALNCDGDTPQSQLIFTTHDTNLLDLDLLRRDEIWFVEKDDGGASHLRSLAEYKIRPDFKAEKGYLNGRFGALPFFGDPDRLGVMCRPADAAA